MHRSLLRLSLLATVVLVAWWFWERGRDVGPRVGGSGTAPMGLPSGSGQSRSEASGAEPSGPAAGEREADGRWRVWLLGPGDRPLAGVEFFRNRTHLATTDSRGRAWFPAPPAGQSLQLRDSLAGRWHLVTGPETVLRIDGFLPLRCYWYDSGTGNALEGRLRGIRTRYGHSAPPTPDGVSQIHAAGTERWIRATLLLDPPAGWTTDCGLEAPLDVRASAFADRLLREIPLVPDLPVRLLARTPEGAPVAGASVDSVVLDGNPIAVLANPTGEDGSTRIRGIPFRPGNSVWIRVSAGDRSESGVAVIAESRDPIEVTILLSEDDSTVETDEDMEFEELTTWDEAGAEPPDTQLEIDSRRRNGLPAAHARAIVESSKGGWRMELQLDSQGRGTVAAFPPGAYRARVDDPAFSPSWVGVALQEGRPTRVEVAEPPGWTARLQVVDARDRPVAAARVRARLRELDWEYGVLRDGEQSLALFTDHNGRLDLPGLPHAKVRIKVESTGHGSASVILPPGREGDLVTIRLE